MVHHYSLSIADEQYYEVTFDTETFKQMSKLRFLKIKLVNLRGSFEHAFKELRWLQWSHCPLQQLLPSDFCPEKLVILELFKSKIRMWEQTKNLIFLKILVLLNSEDLFTTPDFSSLPRLEIMVLHGCTKLEKVDTTIGSLLNLVSLDLEYCISLKNLPAT